MVSVRPLAPSDVRASSRLHGEVLHMEFLARCGPGFLRSYHRAWMASPDGLALAAVEGDGSLVGVLLGALRPASHFRFMVRRHGPVLAARLLLAALTRPSLARELVATRLLRYLRGLGRMAAGVLRRTPKTAGTAAAGSGPPPGAGVADSSPQVGEVTHVMVSAVAQGAGAGRALMEEAQRVAAERGIDELVLVTPPDLAAGAFYEHLGWERDGTLTSRSGEAFVRYRLPL
jgi:GNAT superfamily N-acetyltransferase